MSDLKKCPFCGAEGIKNIHFISETGGELGQIICGRCHGRTGGDLQTFEQAVGEWNNRSEEVDSHSASHNTERDAICSDEICTYCIHHADDVRICEQLNCSPCSCYHNFEGRKLAPIS